MSVNKAVENTSNTIVANYTHSVVYPFRGSDVEFIAPSSCAGWRGCHEGGCGFAPSGWWETGASPLVWLIVDTSIVACLAQIVVDCRALQGSRMADSGVGDAGRRLRAAAANPGRSVPR